MRLSLAIVLASPSYVGEARAQAPSFSQRQEAKRLFNQAHLAYRNGNYEEAVLKWQESYALSKEPLIFESIANAYERLGDTKRALESLEQWRAVAPWREHKALDGRIARLRERAKEDEAASVARDDAKRLADEAAAKAKSREDEERKKREDEERAQRESASASTIAGFTLTGVGAALVVGGIVVDVIASSQRPDPSLACRELGGAHYCREEDGAAIEQSNALAIGGDVGWIAGSAIALSGAALLIFGGGGGDDASARDAEGAPRPGTSEAEPSPAPPTPSPTEDGAGATEDGEEEARSTTRRTRAAASPRLLPVVTPQGGGFVLRIAF